MTVLTTAVTDYFAQLSSSTVVDENLLRRKSTRISGRSYTAVLLLGFGPGCPGQRPPPI